MGHGWDTDGTRLSDGPTPNPPTALRVVTVVTVVTDEKEGFSETPVYDEEGAVDGGLTHTCFKSSSHARTV
jgi:hypothetical protein